MYCRRMQVSLCYCDSVADVVLTDVSCVSLFHYVPFSASDVKDIPFDSCFAPNWKTCYGHKGH